MKLHELLEKGINKVRFETWDEGTYVVIGKYSSRMHYKEDRDDEKHHCLFNGYMLVSDRWEEYKDEKISINPNAYSLCSGLFLNEKMNIKKYDDDKYYRWYADGRIEEEKTFKEANEQPDSGNWKT